MVFLKNGYSNRQPGQLNRIKGRDQHIEVGDPGGPDSMEPANDRRCHGGLRAL
jgi:hypothetical protein